MRLPAHFRALPACLCLQLKKSLKIFEGPADARSMVEPDASSDSEDDADRSPSRGAATGDGAAAAAGGSAAAAGPAAAEAAQPAEPGEPAGGAPAAVAQPPPAAAQPPGASDPGQEARFTALVEQCVQQLNDDYLSREEMLVIKADLAQSAAYFASSQEELSAAYTGMVNLHGELVLLCHWSMTAYTGIVKVGAGACEGPEGRGARRCWACSQRGGGAMRPAGRPLLPLSMAARRTPARVLSGQCLW